jgi:uncharacterized protein YeaO (DUF488 family)
MSIRIVRLGSPRTQREGLRIGTVRRPPRGVRKEDYAARDFFDVWLPELAPSASVVSSALSEEWTDARWRQFTKSYEREMREPPAQRLIAMLAALSHQTNFAVGCYCEDVAHCHRSLLAKLLEENGAKIDFAP